MALPYLLIWFRKGDISASGIAELPEALVHDSDMFYPLPEYFGDVDYLRDEENMLIGFSYILGDEREDQKALTENLLSQSRNVKRQDGMLIILLKSGEYEIECVQATGTQVYRSLSNEFILAIPNWGFGKLGFRLTATDIPVVVRH